MKNKRFGECLTDIGKVKARISYVEFSIAVNAFHDVLKKLKACLDFVARGDDGHSEHQLIL